MDGPDDFKFPFDFDSEFSAAENQIMNDILMQPFDPFAGIGFSFADQYDLADMHFMPLSPNDGQLSQLNSSSSQIGVEPIDSSCAASEPSPADTITGNADMLMSWTNVLEPNSTTHSSELPPNYYEQLIVEEHTNDGMPSETASYQTLETVDVPQLYDKVESTFGLERLKEIDTKLNYPALKSECDANGDADQSPATAVHETKWKTFLLPIKCDANGAESVHRIQQKFKERPDIVMSIIRQRGQRATSNETKILLVAPPKQTKQPSTQYLSVDEQLQRLETEEIVVPVIDRTMKPRKRKSPVKLDTVEVARENILRMLGTDCYDLVNGHIVKRKAAPAPPKMDCADESNRLVELKFGDICKNARRRSARHAEKTLT